jgi:hypothetical protein
LSLNDESGREWFSIVAGIRQASMPGQSTDLNDRRAILDRFDASMLALAGGNGALKCKVEAALRRDADLQEFWAVSADLMDWVQRERMATEVR